MNSDILLLFTRVIVFDRRYALFQQLAAFLIVLIKGYFWVLHHSLLPYLVKEGIKRAIIEYWVTFSDHRIIWIEWIVWVRQIWRLKALIWNELVRIVGFNLAYWFRKGIFRLSAHRLGCWKFYAGNDALGKSRFAKTFTKFVVVATFDCSGTFDTLILQRSTWVTAPVLMVDLYFLLVAFGQLSSFLWFY